jgi:hypothetical protein
MTRHLLGVRLRAEAGLHVVAIGGAELRQAIESDVMVRDRQTVRRDERARAAAVETDRGLLQVLEPGRGRREVVFLLQHLQRRPVEKPHPLVRGERQRQETKSNDQFAHQSSQLVPFIRATIFATSM